jgi:uncharacterized protein (DUF2147 family)
MKGLLFFVVMLIAINGRAQNGKPEPADAIMRVWKTPDKDGKMQVLKNADGYYGKMISGSDLMEADGKTYKKDVNNADPALKTRILKDYTLIWGLVYQDGKWLGGKIYDYENGNTYNVNVEIKDSVLYMRAFMGVPMFGKTVKWNLVQ